MPLNPPNCLPVTMKTSREVLRRWRERKRERASQETPVRGRGAGGGRVSAQRCGEVVQKQFAETASVCYDYLHRPDEEVRP